ncbi:MAG: hypothetical protein EOM23_08670, partial [Candidatus Moranbacteria bacterium]|nr:hypothetical protein [Candidatus Moranbacteria bacterium]
MQINRNNYGAFFIDYRESNLDDRGKEALSEFLKNNPDLQVEFLDFIDLSDFKLLTDKNEIFHNKYMLKRPVVEPVDVIEQDNFEEYIIAFLENDLTKEQKKVFERFVQKNPSIRKEINWYEKTFLKPDNKIICKQKTNLKRRSVSLYHPSIIRRVASIAALILLTFGLFRLTTDFISNQRSTPTAGVESWAEEPAEVITLY